MYKKFLPATLTALVLAMGCPKNVSAQLPSRQLNPAWAKKPFQERQKALEQMKTERRIPEKLRLGQARPTNKLYQVKPVGTPVSMLQPFQAPLKAASGANVTLWADVYFNNDWPVGEYQYGYYSFSPVASPVFTLLENEYADGMRAEDGVQLKGNHLYSVQGTYVGSNYYVYLFDTNISTWETTYESLDDYSMLAHETCRAADGLTYGVFYNEDASASEWCQIDYETQTKTVLGPANYTYKAIGVTKAGMFYGIASDGNLYKFDRNTKQETLVGSTGLTLANSSGQTYTQTGEIDQSDDTFYWATVDINGNAGLYKVNLETAALTQISSNLVGMVGMVIPGEIADDDAPATATDLSVAFEGLNLDGTLTFTAPTTTFSGGALAGSLNYDITCNGTVVKSGKVKAGATVTETVTVDKSGSYTFGVVTKNTVGSSPTASYTVWVGYDQPKAPTDVTMLVNKGKATVFWTKPTAGVHGGVLGDLTYDVYRVNGKQRVKVASDITATQTTDDVSEVPIGSYHYEVYAKNRDLSSAAASSESQMLGDAIEPTWSVQLYNDAEALGVFTVLDNNADGLTWEVRQDTGSDTTFVCTKANTKNGNDDWLFTAPVRMTTDRAYVFKVTARNKYGIGGNEYDDYRNTLEVKWGTSATPAGMTSTLLSATKIDKVKTEYTFEVRPTADGLYYFGLHDCTPDADRGYIYLYDLSIEAGARATAPDQVTNLKLTPGAQGDLSATLSFNAPAKAVDGTAISSVDSIAIVRGSEQIATIGKKNAGEAVTFQDNDIPNNGSYTYIVYAFNGGEYGSSAVVTGYIGLDVPGAPQNVELADQETNVLVSWDAFGNTGVNGGYIDPDEQTVDIYTVAENYYGGLYLDEMVAISEPGATSVTVDQNTEEAITTDGSQSFLYYAGHTTEGASNAVTLSNGIIVGPSIQLPFKESFANSNIDNKLVWVENNDMVNNRSTASYWSTSSHIVSDGDGGAAVWMSFMDASGNVCSSQAGDESTLGLLKVSMKNTEAPYMTFKVYSASREQAKVVVQVQLPDGTTDEVTTFDLSTETKSGWKTYAVDLSAYKSERYIIPSFRGVALGSGINIAIDDINIIDKLTDNLQAASLSVPATVKAGRNANAAVTVKNLGENAASNYTVKLYVNGKEAASTAVSTSLAAMAETTVNVVWPVKVTDEGSVSVTAEVVYDKDMKASDNTTDAKTVQVLPTHTATVNDLAAEKAGEGSAKLTWSTPADVEAVTVTEDFEDYEPWSYAFGEWTLINGNPDCEGGAFFTNYESPFTGVSFAYTIFDAATLVSEFNALAENPGLAAHSGDLYAAAIGEFSADGNSAVAGDDWLVSPVLSGKGQTISFYATNIAGYPETFDILISLTDDSQDSFQKIGSTRTIAGTNAWTSETNWQKFELYVPEGTKYFAIHHNTTSDYAFLFGIDDVTYEAGAECAEDDIVGYNIYRDGELIGTVSGSELTYTDNEEGPGAHNYNVTVLFKDKDGNITESGLSNTVTITTGIGSIEADLQAEEYNVYTLDGRAVMLHAKSLSGLQKGIYVINDRKFIIK